MEHYKVNGMSCAACQARVEKAVRGVTGVASCSVSLLTNSMGVEGTADPKDVIRAVEEAGYGASLAGDAGRGQYSAKLAAEEEALTDHETPRLRKRLIASVIFLLILMYFSMGHTMWNWPIPAFFESDPVATGLLQLLLSGIILVINQRFFISGFRSLLHLAPNMDTLIALGASAAFGYSTVVLFLMSKAQAAGDPLKVSGYRMDLYFESAAMIVTLITVGKMLEAYSKGKTTNALRSLMQMAPKTANVNRNGKEVTVPIDDVMVGDLFVVRPGETIAVDGVITEGSGAVNEAALTGESLPVDKAVNDAVHSGTLNQDGFLTCRATRVGEDSTLAQIIQMIRDAAATKAPVAALADKISGIFVPVVMVIAAVTFLIWMLVGQSAGYSLARAISVLVVSCPCALGLATPVAIMVGNGVGARSGILFKNAGSLQETGNSQIAVLDKTGTITSGEPVVTDVIAEQGTNPEELLSVAYSLELKSEHPLARAVVSYAEKEKVGSFAVTDFSALPGNGLTGMAGDAVCYGGKADFIRNKCDLSKDMIRDAERLAEEGKTPLFFAKEKRLLGIIAVADAIKPDSAEAIRELRNMGLHVVMLTGDNARTAQAVGRAAGVDEVIADVLPDGKEAVIRALRKHGKVLMIGDGINDAPSLMRADIGMAIGAGSDVAIDAASVVLMKNSLKDASGAIRLSRRTYRNILENLFWALFYNVLLIPAAAGAYVKAFGITMNPMLGAAAMSLSSFCVVMNALRLNAVKVRDPSRDKMIKHPVRKGADGTLLFEGTKDGGRKEEMMTKTMKIEGMMCPHCEATVQTALTEIPGVADAKVSHESGEAIVILGDDVGDDALREAVEAKNYKVLEIL